MEIFVLLVVVAVMVEALRRINDNQPKVERLPVHITRQRTRRR